MVGVRLLWQAVGLVGAGLGGFLLVFILGGGGLEGDFLKAARRQDPDSY